MKTTFSLGPHEHKRGLAEARDKRDSFFYTTNKSYLGAQTLGAADT